MTEIQQSYANRAILKQQLVETINQSGLSAFDIEFVLNSLTQEAAALVRKEEQESIEAYQKEAQEAQNGEEGSPVEEIPAEDISVEE
jgi:hypothetical protein